jgi:hypothetical protein
VLQVFFNTFVFANSIFFASEFGKHSCFFSRTGFQGYVPLPWWVSAQLSCYIPCTFSPECRGREQGLPRSAACRDKLMAMFTLSSDGIADTRGRTWRPRMSPSKSVYACDKSHHCYVGRLQRNGCQMDVPCLCVPRADGAAGERDILPVAVPPHTAAVQSGGAHGVRHQGRGAAAGSQGAPRARARSPRPGKIRCMPPLHECVCAISLFLRWVCALSR